MIWKREGRRYPQYGTNQVYSGKTGIRVIPCAYRGALLSGLLGAGSGAPVNIYTPEDTLPKVERDSTDNKDYVWVHRHVSGGNPPALVVILEEDGTTTRR